MTAEKTPEWKLITEAKARKDAALSEKLRAARLARDAAAPPAEEQKKRKAPTRASGRRAY